MKIAILGDTHFGARNDSPAFSKYFEQFYEHCFFPYLINNKIDTVIQLGDVFDRRKFVNFQSLKACKDYFFEPAKELGISLHLLVGNHDTYYKNTNEVNSLNLLLREYNNIVLYEEPGEAVFEDAKIAMMPWICADNFAQSMQLLQTTKAKYVCGHFEIVGFEMHKGAINEEGLEPNVFERFDLVMSGHFHHKSFSRNIHYLGTPYQITWTDYGDPRGFHIFDTETGEIEFVPNPYEMFVKYHYNDQGQSKGYIDGFELSGLEGRIVKVIVRNKDNPVEFDVFVDRLQKAGVADLTVVDDHFNLDLTADDDIVNEAEDTLTILSKYVEGLTITADKKQVESLLRELYSEALSVE